MLALRSIALASVLALAAFAPAERATISLFNGSDYVITHVYMSECSTNDWENDLLGNDVLMPGDDLEVGIYSGCWDLMAVVEGDYELARYSVGVGPDDYVEWDITN